MMKYCQGGIDAAAGVLAEVHRLFCRVLEDVHGNLEARQCIELVLS